LRIVSSSAAAPGVGFILADKCVSKVEAWFGSVRNFIGDKEMNFCSSFSTIRNGMGLLLELPGEATLRLSPQPLGSMLIERPVDPRNLLKNFTRPTRMEGIQAQNMAVVVSRVDQKVAGILSHVGSAVKPNVRRLSRRIAEVMQTL